MAIFLALLSAMIFGAADFCGGVATRRAPVIQVVGGSHLVGGVGVLLASLLLADTFTWSDLGLGAVGGLFGVVGVALLYRRLAVGPMNIVAPLTGITSAVVPMLRGVVDGDRLSALGWLGVVLGLAAITLVSISPAAGSNPGESAESQAASDPDGNDDPEPDPSEPDSVVRVVVESLSAGTGFGLMFVMLDATDSTTSPWPIFGARLLTTFLILPIAGLWLHRSGRPVLAVGGSTAVLIAVVGLLDTGANVVFLYAANAGQLAVVSVLSSLYPISTVLLAWFLLSERMSRLQGVGFVAAVAATELLVLG